MKLERWKKNLHPLQWNGTFQKTTIPESWSIIFDNEVQLTCGNKQVKALESSAENYYVCLNATFYLFKKHESIT
jgi:hypothetical protein